MSFTHPRRTTKTTLSAALTPPSAASGHPSVNTNMSLRKGATFHSPPSSPESDVVSYFRVPSLPRRSQTSLEDVVDAHKRRVALTLGDIDRGLSAVEDRSPTTRRSFRDDALPLPQAFLDHTVATPVARSYGPIMDGVMASEASEHSARRSLRLRRRPARYHESDSGLGTSIVSKSDKHDADSAHEEPCTKPITTASTITRSAAHTSTVESLSRLSTRASNRIHEHILKPLLAKSSLKDFHPIVRDCPRRIHSKEIVCLRDLEKTLIFMAPERTKSAKLYLDFCLTSIRCIQATVEFLSEREQTRPHDRPYTNGYFVDLVDQIKQYAQQVQAAREKEAQGEKLGEMDAQLSDEIRLHGGLTKNGMPAELVRVGKDGKAVSIATGKPVDSLEEDSKSAIKMKRSMSQEAEDDEAIMRSMARRKRSASAAELAPKRCREPGCDKEFKRPCDLTKHEKTHSRPWKCPVETCKYHTYGWPTEKEMDRHHNDKHSAAPPLYECHFKPCPYKSKRESNCKQHMEKAHGWEYVRSKSNGKQKDVPAPSVAALPTPQMTNMHTPSSDGHAVHTPEDDDYDMDILSTYDSSAMFAPGLQNDQLIFPPYQSDLDVFAPPHNFDFSPISDNNQSLGSSSSASPFMMNGMPETDNFQNFTASNNVDFNLFDGEDLYSANVHLPTPDPSVYQHVLGGFETSGVPYNNGGNAIPQLSPAGHGNHMLYTPTSLREVDEGFEDFVPNNRTFGADFPLFPSSTGGSGGTVCSSAPSALFGEIPTMPHGNVPGHFAPTAALANMSAQQLLDYYNVITANAGVPHGGMDWSSSDDQFHSYGRR